MANGSAATASPPISRISHAIPSRPFQSCPELALLLCQGVALIVVVASLRVFRIFEMDCLRRFSQGGQLSCH